MKFYKQALLFGATALVLVGCGADGGSTETVSKDSGEVSTEEVETKKNKEEPTKEGQEKVGEVIEAEGGISTVVGTKYGINETVENGDFTVTLQGATLLQYEPSEDFVEILGGESFTVVRFDVEVTNNTDATNSIYPDQGIAVTDTGAQIDAEMLMSDDVGGDFLGKVTKSGSVIFLHDGNAEDITNVRYNVGSGHGEDFESFGEDLEFSVDFEK